jgi:hypothetical protein
MSSHFRAERPPLRPVAEYEVAPDRYPTATRPDGDPNAMRLSEWRKLSTYKPGEVVWLDEGGTLVKALITDVFNDYDRYGDRREKYRVTKATAKGAWSKSFKYTWPGFIERGYQLAEKRK